MSCQIDGRGGNGAFRNISISKLLNVLVIIGLCFKGPSLAQGAVLSSSPSFSSLRDNSIDTEADEPEGVLPPLQEPDLILSPQPSNFHVIDECIKMTMEEGIYHFKSRGGEQVCGLYLVSDPDKLIVVHVDYLDVQCNQKGLISVVDGWELNGEVFPSVEDHETPFDLRFQELCIDSKDSHRRKDLRRTYTSSQNAALIQYRVPGYGQGFSVRVKHVHNPRPCNILVQDLEAVYKMENFGRQINCSLTTLFDAKIKMVYLSTGVVRERPNLRKYSQRTHPSSSIYHKCGKLGLEDFIQIGGSSGLDTSKMVLIDEFCGHQTHPMSSYTTVFCGMTTLRLVSSGKYQNKIVAEVRKADVEDIDNANFICDI